MTWITNPIWITQWNNPIQLIPRVKGYISSLYPDTKFAISEYDFGAADYISGGIAEADALGIFGRERLYFATRWGDPGTYTDAAYRLYLDYNGQGSRFGNINVSATTSDVVNVPAYAAIDEGKPSLLHVILINRNLTATQTATVTIGGPSTYNAGQAWGFDGTGAVLTARGAVNMANNSFSLDLPALSAVHVVVSTDSPQTLIGVGGAGGTAATSVGSGGGLSTSNPDSGTKNDSGSCGCRLATSSEHSNWALAL